MSIICPCLHAYTHTQEELVCIQVLCILHRMHQSYKRTVESQDVNIWLTSSVKWRGHKHGSGSSVSVVTIKKNTFDPVYG